jgi:hypothetical protein
MRSLCSASVYVSPPGRNRLRSYGWRDHTKSAVSPCTMMNVTEIIACSRLAIWLNNDNTTISMFTYTVVVKAGPNCGRSVWNTHNGMKQHTLYTWIIRFRTDVTLFRGGFVFFYNRSCIVRRLFLHCVNPCPRPSNDAQRCMRNTGRKTVSQRGSENFKYLQTLSYKLDWTGNRIFICKWRKNDFLFNFRDHTNTSFLRK